MTFAGTAVAAGPSGKQKLTFTGTFTPGAAGAGTASSGQVPPHEPNSKQQ